MGVPMASDGVDFDRARAFRQRNGVEADRGEPGDGEGVGGGEHCLLAVCPHAHALCVPVRLTEQEDDASEALPAGVLAAGVAVASLAAVAQLLAGNTAIVRSQRVVRAAVRLIEGLG